MKYTLEVLQDEGDPKTYEIGNAPDEDTAVMLAFAMDGGFGRGIEDYEGGLALAQMYTSIQLWDGKTREQLKAEFEKWDAENGRRAKVWDEWTEGKGIGHAFPSVEHDPEEIAVQGKCMLTLPGDDVSYTSPVLSSPTWGEVLLCFEEAIKITGDYHHSFLEGLSRPEEPEGEVAVVEFSTGS